MKSSHISGICLFLGAMLGGGLASAQTETQHVLQVSTSYLEDDNEKLELPESDSEPAKREQQFGVNKTSAWKVLEFREETNLTRRELLGSLWLVPGTKDQEHDFEITVKSQAVKSELLDCLMIDSDYRSLTIRSDETCDFNEGQLSIDMTIAIRPHLLQFGPGTLVETQTLDIYLDALLNYEVYHMTIQSTNGYIKAWEIDTFTAHEISLSSEHGGIEGRWSFPGAISFNTIDGHIQVDLIPKRWSYGPSTKGDLAAHSISGSIDIRMPLERDKLSMRNSTTNITTSTGVIRAQLVHGASTYIRTSTGEINADLLPYWAFVEWQGVQHNYITTECNACNTQVRIFEGIYDSYYKTRPMYFAKSRHEAKNGAIQLAYPMDWAGSAEWSVYRGLANVFGKDYEVVRDEYDGRDGMIRRASKGSEMNIEVGNGAMILDLSGENTKRRWEE